MEVLNLPVLSGVTSPKVNRDLVEERRASIKCEDVKGALLMTSYWPRSKSG